MPIRPHLFVVLFLAILHAAAHAAVVSSPVVGLPAPWQHQDIGDPGRAGNAISEGSKFTILGGGADIGGVADECHFAYQKVSGDAVLVARVAGMRDTNLWAKAGVMIRESLGAGSRHALMAVTPERGTMFLRRRVADGLSVRTAPLDGIEAPCWLKITRIGNVLSGYRSRDAVRWKLIGSDTIPMSSSVYIGLAVTARDDAKINSAVFDKITATASPNSLSGYSAARDFSSEQGFRGWTYCDSGLARLPAFDGTRWSNPSQPDLRIWTDGCHPGPSLGAVRRWTATKAGPVGVFGNVHDLDSGGGDGVLAVIHKNGVEVWRAVIANGDATGANFSLPVSLIPGDTLDFIVNPNGNNFNDSTYFNPAINYLAYDMPAAIG
jgi:regulation of enolase protein 1 (concanavalin A-like superfamily)